MKIEYQDAGHEARLIITSCLTGWRKHIHLVDEILLSVPQLRAVSEGFFIMTTTVSGFTADILRAESVVEKHGYRVLRS
ncbi:hypothetical protein DPU24_26315 [Salmonella enterica subsp. enterica serovar Oranienburg]|nr:hypothetical protein [Salmonella enterica subsp. enterica serovar Oranienburg]EDV5541886.1 hypothetical protein [Salmonella enterica subsp. enterica]EGB0328025.1 hypothetical protein [Salmonella enterica]HEC8456648.1 hypothetical protein [Salmonella enterica subsp. enterica serovar Poona]EHK2735945.1 hypothetical protein [Salmonella enterica]